MLTCHTIRSHFRDQHLQARTPQTYVYAQTYKHTDTYTHTHTYTHIETNQNVHLGIESLAIVHLCRRRSPPP